MKCIILLVLLAYLFELAVGAPALDLEVDSNGEVIPSSSTVQLFVTVVNKMDKAIQLFWDAPGNNEAEDIHMFDIEAKQTQGHFIRIKSCESLFFFLADYILPFPLENFS